MNQFWKDLGMQGNILYLLKWGVISLLIGIVTGLVGAAFGHAVAFASASFQAHPVLLFFLPAAGLLILLIYHVFGEDDNRGTNMVLESIYAENRMRLTMTPTVFLGSVLTHLCGGSAGREGAGLQMGGSIGTFLGGILRLDEKDMNIAVMCGMSGAFAALFGTPVAAAIFSMEVISVGVIYYAALVPCIFSAFTAAGLASLMGLSPTRFTVFGVPRFDVRMALLMILLGVLASGVAALFCIVLGAVSDTYGKFLKKPWQRILTGAVLVILLTLLSGGTRYNGSGGALIEEALAGGTRWYDFLLKILFTAVTLEAGFKGGEIVPSFAIGACFGCLFGNLAGIGPGLCAACGMLALFAGVTNAPLSTLIIGLEMFGYSAMPFFAIVTAVSFTLSGYYSLYSSQKAVYSKTKTEYVNVKMHTDVKVHPFE